MPRRPLLLLLVLIVAGCGSSGNAAAPGSSVPPPERQVTLALDWYPNADHVGLFTGIDHGIFMRQGLRIDPRPPSDVSDPIKLVVAGRADLGISYEPELFFAQQEHAPVVAVAALVPRALNSIIARRDEGITTVADLKGKTIGEDGSRSTAAYLDAVLRHAGLDPDHDVKTVDVGFNLVPALVGKKVDAVIGVFRNIEGAQLAARGIPISTFPVDENGVPSYDELVLVADRDRLTDDASYRSMMKRFVAALGESTAYAKGHPAEALAAMRNHVTGDQATALADSVTATLGLLDTTHLEPSAWNAFGRWMQAQGLLDSPPDGAAL